jgi:hypothetical protein|tara:strand:- start:6739 stop:7728 length:990 start_codon:yes stop_codon:yes gene_type:complete
MANKDNDLIFEAYNKKLNEDWEKGTSKAPKGKSFDMSRGGAPSNVDAARDGAGGRYRKTRPPSAPSKKTHGEMEENIPEEDDLGLGPMVGRIMKLAGDLNNDMSRPAKVTVHIQGLEDEEDDRVSSYMKLQKAKENMLKMPDVEKEERERAGLAHARAVADHYEDDKKEDGETVYIQAGMPESDCGDDCECDDCSDDNENYDGELDMARVELLKANEYAAKLFKMVGDKESLEGWVASKITKASDYLSSVYHYLDYNDNFDNVEDESVELDTLQGTDTAKDTGFAGDQEDQVNDELKEKHYEEGQQKGLSGKDLEDYVELMMSQPGPHG